MNKKQERNLIRTIRSHAPVRINDIGGWTDTWYSKKGKVLNMAVSPGVEVKIKVFENIEHEEKRVSVYAENFGDLFLVDPEHPKYDQHPLLQAAINSIQIPRDFKLDIKIYSPIPAGSSTGTSGCVCLSLLGALDSLFSQHRSAKELASLAHRVETENLGWQSGIQDQICAAYGGVCFIDMYSYPHSNVSKLELSPQVEKALDDQLCLIYLGSGHSSSALHEEVIRFLEEKGSRFKPIDKMRELAMEAKDFLIQGDLHSFGKIMIENNECQRSLHPSLISGQAESVIQIAKKHQALGWKVNGAGGEGGSLTLLSAEEENQKTKMLEEINSLGKGIQSIPISLNLQGLGVSIQS